MATLPASTDYTSSGATQGAAKTYMGTLRAFIADLLGTDSGDKPAARAALGAAALGANADITALSALTSVNGGALAGFRNLVINGACQVAEAGSAAVVLDTFTYGGCDGFITKVGGTTAAGTIAQYSDVGPTGFAHGAQATTTGIGTVTFQHRVESLNARHLNGRTVMASALVYQNSGLAQNATIALSKPSVTADTFGAQTVLSTSGNQSVPSGVATRVYWSYTLGAADATLGLAVSLQFLNIGTVTSKDFWVTEFQLEVGDVVTAFELRTYGGELALCQRYYWKAVTVALGRTLSGSALNNGAVKYPVRMRSAPTLLAGATFQVSGGAAGTVQVVNGTGALTTDESISFQNSGTAWTANAFASVSCELSSRL